MAREAEMKQTHRWSIRSQSSEVSGIQQSVFWDEGIEGSVFRGMALASTCEQFVCSNLLEMMAGKLGLEGGAQLK
jgi:hypothetical protein